MEYPSLLVTAFTIFKHEMLVLSRKYSELLYPLICFVMISSLFPLAISPDPHLLQTIAPGVIWIAALLAVLLSLESLFQTDLQDGTLEQLLLTPQPLAVLLLGKLLAHWLLSILPFLVLAPLVGIWFQLSANAIKVLVISLMLGTPVLLLLGAIGRALTLQLGNKGLLLLLLILPLFIPILIFGAGSVALANQNMAVTGQLAWLGFMLFLALPLAPLAIAASLRIGIS